MPPFFDRLKAYYTNVGEVLRGEAEMASIFPNTTDVGQAREHFYAEFLKHHVPLNCDVQFGGYLFNLDGQESRQLDIMVTANVSPRYNFLNRDGTGKTFACVDGTIAVVSVKSNLDSTQLIDAIENLISIPSKQSLAGRMSPLMNLPMYEEWPHKIIYASNGASAETIKQTLENYFIAHSDIPDHKKPNLIHVAGKYCAVRTPPQGLPTRDGTPIPGNTFFFQPDTTDVFALVWAVDKIQQMAMSAAHIFFRYDQILDQIPF